jgi:hypothetical protein
MYAAADNMSDFTGVLVKRQYKPGQKYIQLLFQTSDGPKLSISRNPKMVQSLSEGQTYRVEGQEYTIGERSVIKEPSATLVEANRGFIKWNIKFIIAGVALLVILGATYAILVKSPTSSATNAVPTKSKVSTQNTSTDETSKESSQTSAPTETDRAQLDARTGNSSATPQNNRVTTNTNQMPATNVSNAQISPAASPASDPSSDTTTNTTQDTQPQADVSPPAPDTPTDQTPPASP